MNYDKKEEPLEKADENKIRADKAVEIVVAYLKQQGFEKIEDVTKNKNHKGYDILAVKDGKEIRIEVKGCKNDRGIPDCHDTLFNSDKSVVADFFYIVRINSKIIEILSKEEIDRYKESHKWIKRLRTTRLDGDLYKGLIGKKVGFSA